MSFEVINSEVIYRGPVFSVRQDELDLPDGRRARLDIVEHRHAVTIIPLDQNGDVWFIRQYRHAVGKWILELPAGVMEEGETPDTSAQREIREEIYMSAENLQRIGGFYLAPGYSTEYMHVFLGTDLHPDPLQRDADEFIAIEKIPSKKALTLVESGQIQDAKSIISLFWAFPLF